MIGQECSTIRVTCRSMQKGDMGMSKLDDAIAMIKAGDMEQGRRLLIELLEEEPRNVQAWLWMSGVVRDPERRRQSLLAALEIDPDNELARKGLAKFGWVEDVAATVTLPPEPTDQEFAPVLREEEETPSEAPAGEALLVPEPEQEAGRSLPFLRISLILLVLLVLTVLVILAVTQ